jgi:DNA-binding transcriptional regulator YhcF (GntR family)
VNFRRREVLMKIFNDDSPLYLQLRKHIEERILNRAIGDDEPMPSLRNMARDYNLNPITVGNAIGALVDEGILYKKRGVGIYVTPGARKMIIKIRTKDFAATTLEPAINMAKQLEIPKRQIMETVECIYGGNND